MHRRHTRDARFEPSGSSGPGDRATDARRANAARSAPRGRRAFLAGTGVACLSALAGCLGDGDDGTDRDDPEVDPSPPFAVRTVEASGSEAGATTIPQGDRPAVVAFVQTHCPTAEETLQNLAAAREDRDAADSVDAVAVLHGGVRDQRPETVADWWEDRGVDWPVGIDEDGALHDFYDIDGSPVVVVIDGDGEVRWREDGGTAEASAGTAVRRALEAATP